MGKATTATTVVTPQGNPTQPPDETECEELLQQLINQTALSLYGL